MLNPMSYNICSPNKNDISNLNFKGPDSPILSNQRPQIFTFQTTRSLSFVVSETLTKISIKMSDNILPHEIQLEIIKKVSDVKSLIRFRSVSKPWKSFIDGHEFIAFYGARHTQPHRLLLRYMYHREFKYISFIDDVSFPQQQQLDFAPYVPDLIKQLNDSTVIGSSCGLWCLHGSQKYPSPTEIVVIWNPSIRKSVGIVLPCLVAPGYDLTIGFGVCPSTYDPTIVKISYSCWPLKGKDTNHWHVEIFTLSSKTWKMISSNLPRESIKIRSPTQVSIDRFIYWSAYDNVLNYKHLILSFDLITHDFKEVNFAVSITTRVASDISLSKLNESLVVSAFTDEVNDMVYGIWVMGEEGGVMTSFTKLFTIKTPILISQVLGFTSSGEAILETEKLTEVFATVKVYKPCSQQINEVGMTGEGGSFFIYPYTETLLLVDHSD